MFAKIRKRVVAFLSAVCIAATMVPVGLTLDVTAYAKSSATLANAKAAAKEVAEELNVKFKIRGELYVDNVVGNSSKEYAKAFYNKCEALGIKCKVWSEEEYIKSMHKYDDPESVLAYSFAFGGIGVGFEELKDSGYFNLVTINSKTYYFNIWDYDLARTRDDFKEFKEEIELYDLGYEWGDYSSTSDSSDSEDEEEEDELAAPVITGISYTYEKGVSLKWDKVSGATGYRVYRKTKGGSWEVIKGDTGKTKYTDKTAKYGTKYTYGVRAYSGKSAKAKNNTWSGYGKADITATDDLDTPVISEISYSVGYYTSEKGVTLKWNEVSGASGYEIVRKTEGGSWEYVGKNKSAKKTEYRDENVEYDSKYTYGVRAYRKTSFKANKNKYKKEYWSARGEKEVEAKDALKAPEITEITYTAPYTSEYGVKITWSKVEGATGYRVFRKEDGKNSWEIVEDNTEDTTLRDKGAKTDKKYKYAVRAYRGKYKEANKDTKKDIYAVYYWSKQGKANVTTTDNLASPTITECNYTHGSGVKIAWNAVNGAVGYRIYRKTDETDWEIIKSNLTGTECYIDSKVELNTKYYYSVRAYRGDYKKAKKNNNTVYWSELGAECACYTNDIYDKGKASANAAKAHMKYYNQKSKKALGKYYNTKASKACGVSCAAMIASYYGLDYTTEDIIKNNGDGTANLGSGNFKSSDNIKYKYTSSKKKTQDEMKEILDQKLELVLSDPQHNAWPIVAIDNATTGNNHYVIVIGKNDDGTYIIVDPSNSIKAEEDDEKDSERTILIPVASKDEKSYTDKSYTSRIKSITTFVKK